MYLTTRPHTRYLTRCIRFLYAYLISTNKGGKMNGKKVKGLGKVCYLCSAEIMTNDNYTTLVHKQRGSDTMALAHTDWTDCQRAINRPIDRLDRELALTTAPY